MGPLLVDIQKVNCHMNIFEISLNETVQNRPNNKTMTIEHLKFELFSFWIVVIFSANQGLRCCFYDRRETISMGHSREIELLFISISFSRIGSKKRSTNGSK